MGGILQVDTIQNNNATTLITQTNSTTLTFGVSGQNIVIPSGVTFNTASATINYPAGSILNAAINASAAIAYSKLNLSNSIVNADIASNAAIATTKLGAGAVLQAITATDSTGRSTTSSSFVTASNTLSVSITPSSASNKIFVICTCGIGMSSTAHTGAITIFRGATDLGSGAGGMSYFKNIADDGLPASVSVLDSPSTTSSTTYQIYVKNVSGGTTYLNSGKSSITAFEIAG